MSEPSPPPGSGSGGGAKPRSAGSSTLDPLIGRVLLDRYEILQRIGSGGMGAVYVGRQRAVDRKVALKVLRADLMSNDHVRQRFRREAEIMAKLKHPNTVQLIDYGETEDGLAVMVLELLEGKPLNDRLKEGPLPMTECLKVGEEIAASLAEAHLYGLVHRDLKPANIFLARSGPSVHAKVLDFGIARLLDEEATRLTSTGQVFGTPRYMSPEQAMSTGDVDARSDLYSLGLIIYECAVGQPPFVAQTSIQYLSAHTTQAPPKLREAKPDAPPALELLIDACLAKDPADRPATAEDVGRALQAIRRALETGSDTQPLIIKGGGAAPVERPTEGLDLPIGPGPGARPKAGLGAGGMIAAAVVVAVLLGGIAYAVLRPEKPLVVVALDAGPIPPRSDVGVQAPLDAAAAVVHADPGDDDAGEEAPTEPDAGLVLAADDPADAGLLPADDPVDEPPSKGKHGRRKRDAGVRTKVVSPPPGNGVITGPAGLVIETDDDDGVNLVKLAKGCKASVYTGLGKVTTQRCPADCALIIDAQCAGLTPAEDRAVPPGRRNVSVVCGDKVVRTGTVRFEADESTVFTCR